jgi:hypothetical protein
MKNILTVGDSFTYGEELDDIDEAYPYKLAKILKGDVVNLAKPGTGNTSMIRNVIQHITEKNPIDLVIIGWTSPGRMEFSDANGTFDIWPGYSGRKYATFEPWRIELLEYINKHHDPSYIYQQYLIDIIMMQSFLTNHNIKYLMLTTMANEYYHNIYQTQMLPLVSLIDSTYFPGWPTEGMAEWTQGCKRGPGGHFLNDGHKQITKKLYEHIRNLGWL